MSYLNYFIRSFLFSFPVILLILFNNISSLEYYHFDNDATPSYYGMGYSWINGLYPKLYFHQPAYFFQEISSIFVLLTGYNKMNISGFNDIGIIFNIVSVILVSIWVSYTTIQFKVKLINIFLIGLIFASFPTTLVCISIWTFNIPIIYMLAPIGIILFYSMKGAFVSENINMTFYIGIGFILANYFVAGIIILILFLEKAYKYFFKSETLQSMGIKFDLSSFFNYLELIIPIFLISCSWLFINIYELDNTSLRLLISKLIIFSLGLYFFFIFTRIKKYRDNIFCYIIIGWAIGANLFAIPWFYSLIISFLSTGGTNIGLDEVNNYNIINFIKLNIWNYLYIFSSIILFCLFIFSIIQRTKDSYLPFLLLLLIICNLIVVYPVISLIDSESYSRIGLSSRYLMISLVVMSSVILFSELNIKYYKIIVFPIVFILCLYSIIYYTSNLENHLKKVNANLNELNIYLSELKSSQENVKFYTVEALYPLPSSKLYSINKNVSSRSKNYNQNLKIDNFIYIPMNDLNNLVSDLDSDYFIHENNLGDKFIIIREFKDIKINISKLIN